MMKTSLKSVIAALSVVLFLFLAWYFRSIVAYILISGVLSIVGRPIVNLFCKIHIKKWKFPRALAAILTLLIIFAFIALTFLIFVPLITNQINIVSSIDSSKIIQLFEEPIATIETFFRTFSHELPNDMTLRDYLTTRVSDILDFNLLQSFIGTAVGVLGNIIVTLFALSFITFFFLKDQELFFNSILMWIPDKYTEGFTRALNSIANLLTRYFVGILLESTFIMIIIDTGMTIIGINFQQALVMGFVIGLLNVIPYIGPWIGFAIAMLMGIASQVSVDISTFSWAIIIYMAVVVAIAQVIDNIFFQPIIYSNSVKAHPLEIFVVVLVAGSFVGIGGMILAIPSYTVMRVLAKEFFNNFKAVQKITSGLNSGDKGGPFKAPQEEEPTIVNTEK